MSFELKENVDGDVELIHDTSGDSLIVDSLSTENLVDAPVLVTEQRRHISRRCGSLDTVSQTTNGSGVIRGGPQLKVDVSAGTADSFARLVDKNNQVTVDFSNDMVIRVAFNHRIVGGSSGDQCYFTVGSANLAEDTYSKDHIGVGFKAGDLVGTHSGGGTSNTVETLVAGISEDVSREVWMVWDSSVQSVEWYVDTKPPDASSPDATATNEMPSTADASNFINVTSDNDANANRNFIYVSEYEIGVA